MARTPAQPLAHALVAVTCMLALVGCSDGGADLADQADQGHLHTSLPAGDGTTPEYVGYALRAVTLPARAAVPGQYTFRIENYRGRAQTDFRTEQTKKMHVYVVSEDLSVFRHLHPAMAPDGTWSGNLTLPRSGAYRLVVEFLADDGGGNADHLILGAKRAVAGARPVQTVGTPPPTDRATVDGVTVQVRGPLRAGPDGENNRMRIGVSHRGEAASLGTFLGVSAHVTGFAVDTGSMVHVHPLGPPEVEGDAAWLTFHTAFPRPGDYRVFVQVRVSGIVRTVPITLAVGEHDPLARIG